MDDERREVKHRRKRWVDFVKATRATWTPTKNSAVCSNNFTPDSFERRFSHITESQETETDEGHSASVMDSSSDEPKTYKK